ncbi:MAG TPA: hypothetical protein ENG51_21080, partial [Deltaproteobacteria bacterium]|nr:hypothetical protein [Deltaproteobacteria bacterium]
MIDPKIIQRIIDLIKIRRVNYEYFFKQLKSPVWISALKEHGFFSNPPEPVRESDYISFPFWPESSYLARMSSEAPEEVCEIIIHHIPDTDNIHIHEDFVDAALNMPANFAAKIAEKEIRWIEKQDQLHLLLPDKLGQLIVHLAKGGETESALRLARTLLAISAESPSIPETEDEDKKQLYSLLLSPKPRPKFDIWEYEEILQKYIPSLVEAAGEKTLE